MTVQTTQNTTGRLALALVLGANGGVGGETAAALVRHGWTVRALVRDPAQSGLAKGSLAGVQYVKGDVMDRAAVVAAAEGASIIVHAVNPPGYRGWKQEVLPMIDNSIAAARAVGARVMLPGTIYNYDPAAQSVIDEATPQRAFTRKGEIRIAMEARLEAAAAEGVHSLILRAGDYFGPRSTMNSWFASGLVTPGKPVKTILYPGDKGVGHAWAYLPDVGETFARLADREAQLPAFARFHFEGVWDEDGTAMIRAIARAAGQARPNARRLPWALLPFAGLFSETLRELAEMRPFWRHPVRLENRKLVAFLGEEPRTPLDVAVRATMRGLDVPVAEMATPPRLLKAA
jgi:nucleoside-diphosphate-sugar epimerase